MSVTRAGLLSHLIPVLSVNLTILFLGESLHLYHLLGAAEIMGGTAISMRGER